MAYDDNRQKVAASIDQTIEGTTNGVVVKSITAGSNTLGATKDAGPNWTPTRTYTASANMTTAADIAPAPAAGLKVVADDILISSDTALSFSIQEADAATVFAKVFLPANGTVQITLRDGLKLATAAKAMQGKASAAGNVAITACTHAEA